MEENQPMKKEQKPFYKDWRTLLGTTNHAEIGLLYIVFAMINFVLAGLLAMLIRIELISPGQTIIDSDTYSTSFTIHGTVMIFLAVFPLGLGLGNYLVPKWIGAKDLYWPRLNNAAFWMMIPSAFFIYAGRASVGWTAYPPLSAIADFSVDFWILGLLLSGISSLIGNINLLMTIISMRKPEITWSNMDLFSWSIFYTGIIQLFALPVITSGLVMLLLDRIVSTTFFTVGEYSGPLLWQHLFWSYSHPAVYVIILPWMGLTSVLISKFAQNEVFGYKGMVASMFVITGLGYFVWGHHMFTSYGIGPDVVFNYLFNFTTFLIAIPSGIKTFNWVLTMYGGRLKLEAPLLFPIGFIFGFVIGGISGVFLNILPIDMVVHDTYFVVGHFHMIALGGVVSTMFGVFYYLWPYVTGKMYDRRLAFIHWVIWMIGSTLSFGIMHILGLLGMPRRYFDYSSMNDLSIITLLNQLATIGAILQFIAISIFLANIALSLYKGLPAEDDPFNFGPENEKYRV